jgi:predicted RNA binding protein YcfA (HicA-like mRNA interferase family)
VKLPRDITGTELSQSLKRLGYSVTHQTGSHIRLTTLKDGEHHITIPAHDPIRIGTLSAIFRDLMEHHKMDRDSLLKELLS